MIRQWSNAVVWYINIFEFWAWNNSMISSDNCFAMRLSNPIDKREKSATISDKRSIFLWQPLTKLSSRDHLWWKYQTNLMLAVEVLLPTAEWVRTQCYCSVNSGWRLWLWIVIMWLHFYRLDCNFYWSKIELFAKYSPSLWNSFQFFA